MKMIRTYSDLKKFIDIDYKLDEALVLTKDMGRYCEAAIRYTVKTYRIPDNIYIKWIIRTHGGMFIGYDYTMFPKEYKNSVRDFNKFKEFKRRKVKSWKK